MKKQAMTVVATLFAVICSHTFAASWPQFRGVQGDGVSTEKNLPVKWSEGSGVRWSVDLPGRANSSPAVTSKRIDVTSQTDDALWLISIDRKSGDIIRSTKVGTGKLAAKGPARLYAHRHNAATPTPCADEERTYAFFGSGLLVCVNAATGKTVWQHDMNSKYGPYDITFGMGASPRLWGDLLIVSCMTKGPSYVVAFDKRTGKEVWKSSRQFPAKNDGPDAYSTPVIYKAGNEERLAIAGSDHINTYTKSGQQVWYSSGLTIDSPYGRVIASPVISDGVVIATSANPGGGGKGHILAVRDGGRGNVSRSHFAWKHTQSTPDSSTPVCVGGLLFTCHDQGIAMCLDVKSGEVKWRKRIAKGPYHAALVAGDGKVYFQSTTGECTVIAANETGDVLSVNKLTGNFFATPAISNRTLYLRAYEKLYAIGE